MNFDINNWYWIVGNDGSHVFSSATGSFMPVTDPAYVAWLHQMRQDAEHDHMTRIGLDTGRIPSHAATHADLFNRLKARLPLVAKDVAPYFLEQGWIDQAKAADVLNG